MISLDIVGGFWDRKQEVSWHNLLFQLNKGYILQALQKSQIWAVCAQIQY